MRTEELDFELPADRIATTPAEPRDAARLMVVQRHNQQITHTTIHDLPSLGLLDAGDLLVMNRSKVLPASFRCQRVVSGGVVRGLYLSAPVPNHWLVLLEARGRLQSGEHLRLSETNTLRLVEPRGGGCWLVHCEACPAEILAKIGSTPLPPYLLAARRRRSEPELRPEDAVRYNTVYAHEAGSVAAPTAGLHFTDALLEQLQYDGIRRAEVILHVGRGTFEPIRCEWLGDHKMHQEWCTVPGSTLEAVMAARSVQNRIIPVGTTTVRALESLPDPIDKAHGDHTIETDLFIQPDNGFCFRFTDALLTNFHLPRSSLLAMVAALPGVGIDRLKEWYAQAIEAQYRFYSYGDAMLIL